MQLTRAFSPLDLEEEVCWMCEVQFQPTSILIHGGPLGDSMCETCFSYCALRQKLSEIGISWPTWEQYRAFRDQYPEPIFDTEEEFDLAEDRDGYESIERVAFLASTSNNGREHLGGEAPGRRSRIIELRERTGNLEAELASVLESERTSAAGNGQ